MRVRVNPIECTAQGLCAEIFPEWIALDEWGYPAIDDQPVPVQLVKEARRAAAACPTRALRLDQD